jgi:hypothetical protein
MDLKLVPLRERERSPNTLPGKGITVKQQAARADNANGGLSSRCMAEKIHYDDNIFFMTALIRTLDDAVKLSVDADYFADKVLEDTLFIDSSIQKLYSSLKNNLHLIRRNSYLHSIMKLKKAYGRLLENLLSTTGNLAVSIESMRPKIRRIAASHLNDVKEIRESLEKNQDVKPDSDTISYDELNFLMSPMEENLN